MANNTKIIMLDGRMLIHLFLFISVVPGSSLNSQQRRRTENKKEEGQREREEKEN
jgi:hypothetical protein